MSHDALHTYLNDHLAGATLGCDHARQLEQATADTPFGPAMARVAQEIEEDRDSLVELMDDVGATRNPVKQAGAWVAEKAGRVKFSGLSSGSGSELGHFLALEMMSIGLEGKRSLWKALDEIADQHPELQHDALQRLIDRAVEQRETVETERLAAAHRGLES